MTDTAFPEGGEPLRRDGEAAPGRRADRVEPQRVADAGTFGAGLPGYGRVDPAKAVPFTWRGRRFTGRAGDTLASALLANGVRVVGRSFKYHRPRGVTSAGVEETGAMVTVGVGARRTPNVNAATLPLSPGLRADGQNAWPSVGFDMARVNDMGRAFLGAGFYYKTFFSAAPSFWPAAWPGAAKGSRHWMLFERFIRRAAGMGRLTERPDPDPYETAHMHCDVLVVGGGPAGISAALTLAQAGRDVVLAEQDTALGGRLLSDRGEIEGRPPADWLNDKTAALAAAGVRVLSRASVFGLYDGGVAGVVEQLCNAGDGQRDFAPGASPPPRERLWLVRSAQTLIAAGAAERSLAFADNDRPGVMTAGAVRSYVTRYGVRPGNRIVVAAADPSGYQDLDALAAAGAHVTILDLNRGDAKARASGSAGVVLRAEAAPIGTRADLNGALAGVRIASADGASGWRADGGHLDADILAVAGGWSPLVQLACFRGGVPVWSKEKQAFLVDETRCDGAIAIAGAAEGWRGPDAAAASGRNAARRLLGAPQEAHEEAPPPVSTPVFEIAAPDAPAGRPSFVDLLHDVTAKDLRQADREGYVSVEHMKRYTTLGMAVDQGKTGGALAIGVVAAHRGVDMNAVGTTRFRPPFTPVSIGALAGERDSAHFKPLRRSPLHDRHLKRGAEMTDAGLWRRPWRYATPGETLEESATREAAATRRAVGVCDVSTLGKIQVQGPDAAAFLDRVYVNGFAKLPVGKARYGVMLRDDGLVLDDGTAWRLAEDDFMVTTTTAEAGHVMAWLEKLKQTRWPEMQVALESVTDRWAALAVAGPLARRLLAGMIPSIDFDDDAFPYMGVRRGALGGAPCMIARLSFSGELAYEVYTPAGVGPAAFDALAEAAETVGGGVYGLEALSVLRIEKGHVAGGEIDGRVSLNDLGLGGMASRRKAYVGQALAGRPATADPDRPRLVGLVLADDAAERFETGAVLCKPGATDPGAPPTHGVGWVSSVAHSPALDRWIGLGFVEGGLDRWADAPLIAADPVRGRESAVRAVSPHFFDPEGGRLRPAVDPVWPGPTLAPPPASFLSESPLGNKLAAGERPETVHHTLQGGSMSLTQEEAAPAALTQITAFPDRGAGVGEALRKWSGADLPAPGRFTAGDGDRRLIRTGPLAWLAAAPYGALGPAEIVASKAGVVAQTDGLCGLALSGSGAKYILSRLCAVDLRDRNLPIGAAWRSDLDHVRVLFLRTAHARFELWIPRSFFVDIWERCARTAAMNT